MDEKSFSQYIGQQLRIHRKQNLLTLDEVAYRIDMDGKYLGKIERGERNTSVVTFYKLLEALHIPNTILDEMRDKVRKSNS